jgi:hypothetical protein
MLKPAPNLVALQWSSIFRHLRRPAATTINDAAAIRNFPQGKWGSPETQPAPARLAQRNLHLRGQTQICTFFKQ